MRLSWELLRILVAVSVLSFFLSAYFIFSTYSSAPSRLAVSCDVYGRPVVGYKTELLSWLILPSLTASAVVTGVLNIVALAGVKMRKLGSKVMAHGPKALYPLPLAASLFSLFTGWIDVTTLLAASSLVPIYPLLIAIWFTAASLSLAFFLAIYMLWIGNVIQV